MNDIFRIIPCLERLVRISDKLFFGNYYKIFILSFSKDDCSASVGTHTAAEVSMPTLT